MDDDIAGNRFAPPRAQVADIAADIAGAPVVGTRWARLGAALVDVVVGTVVYVAVMLSLHGLAGFRPENHEKVLPGLIVYYVVNYVIYGWFLYKSGQSIGKIVAGLRIVRSDGSQAAFLRTFLLRGVLFGAIGLLPWVGTLFVVGECLLIFGPARRCLHDYVADTIVVTAASSPLPARAPASAATAA
jgi:uncharacterized RDD family membrane protein YckC